MSAIKKTRTKYTLEEYAELEKGVEERLEYYDGSVWSMAGASPTHEEIVANTITELKNNLHGKGCRVFGSNLRVKVPVYSPYRYADVTALCEQPVYEDFYGLKMLVNPNLIVEVLSDSTESFDLTDKIYLSSLDCEIALAEIYLDVEFPKVERPRFPFEREDFR
ncbi:MAG: Uma2 family endonuclease [Pyrinomonadaceae bacterium]